MRVHLDNFDVSPTEFARLWVEQNRYIDHLESRLREAEEEMLQIKVARKSDSPLLAPPPSLGKSDIISQATISSTKTLPSNVMEVQCMSVSALLYMAKYESGSRGKCILINEEWMTPNEFEKKAGSKAKKYLSSIKCSGRPLRAFVNSSESSSESSSQVPSILDHNYCSKISTANIEKVNKSTQTYGKVSMISQESHYSQEEIRRGTLLMYCSLKAYELMRSSSEERLPSPRTIRRHLQNFQCYYGVNDEMFFLLEQKLKTLPVMQRNVSVVFDEMSVQPTTNYSTRFKERLPKSRKALVIMVRGLLASFKEVIYYNFDTVLERDRGKGKANIDLELLGEIIERVERA